MHEGSRPSLTMQEDSSLTRSDAYFLDLLKRAGYTVTGSALQRNFPKGLFKVSPWGTVSAVLIKSGILYCS